MLLSEYRWQRHLLPGLRVITHRENVAIIPTLTLGEPLAAEKWAQYTHP